MTRHMIPALLGAAVLIVPAASLARSTAAEVIGIPRAVAIAEGLHQGRTVEAELDYERGRLVYEVIAASGDKMNEVLIDATSGEIVAERPRRIEGFLRSWFQADRFNAVRAAPAPLSQILTKIEADNRQRVREVKLKRERGQTFYEVELADAGRLLLVDPRTGVVRDGGFDD